MKIAIVCPHLFMQDEILDDVIFSPGRLAIELVNGLSKLGHLVTLFSPGIISSVDQNSTADLSLFQKELKGRRYGYKELLSKHPALFMTLARQVQTELIAEAYTRANAGEFDIVHIYMNEEELALIMQQFCTKPVVFTHHEPFNFLIKYKSIFPKYRHLNWISISHAQRTSMPSDTNWIGNVYHGLDVKTFSLNSTPKGNYVAYFGRIIEPKGVHLAIQAVKKLNANQKLKSNVPLTLKIAGKHYTGEKDKYWHEHIKPHINDTTIQYVGFISDQREKEKFLGNAKALLMPSIWDEPFGMSMIEAMACGTPVIGFDYGAIPEVIDKGKTGVVVQTTKHTKQDDDEYIQGIVNAINTINEFDRKKVRKKFEERFSLDIMVRRYEQMYENCRLAEKQRQ